MAHEGNRLDRISTYFLFFQFEEGYAVGEQFDVVLGPLLRGSLLGKRVADLHVRHGHIFLAVLLVVLLLEPVHVVGHHLLLVHLVLVLVLLLGRAPVVLSSCTLRSHLLLLHHLTNTLATAS